MEIQIGNRLVEVTLLSKEGNNKIWISEIKAVYLHRNFRNKCTPRQLYIAILLTPPTPHRREIRIRRMM